MLARDFIHPAFKRFAEPEVIVANRQDFLGLDGIEHPVRQGHLNILEHTVTVTADGLGTFHQTEDQPLTFLASHDVGLDRGATQTFKRFFGSDIGAASEPQISQPTGPWLYKVQTTDRADVDISGPEFDFVRSIKVFNIQYNQRRNHDGECNRTDATQLGTYGTQGDYRWTRSTSSAVPASSDFDLPTGCNDYFYRSVFIDWRDYLGNYGSEEVRY